MWSCLVAVLAVLSVFTPCSASYAHQEEKLHACGWQAFGILDKNGEGVDMQPQIDLQNQLNAWHAEHKSNVHEGNTGSQPVQQKVYYALAQLPCVQHICEIGFNGGHSSTTWLAAKSTNTLFSMDLGEHDYAYTAMKFYAQKAPGRITWALGSSVASIPALASHHRHKCDIVIVDGGHDYEIALADIKNMRSLANPHFSILIIDDSPCTAIWCLGPNKAIEELEKQGAIHIIKSFPDGPARGFVVGVFLSAGLGSEYLLPNITKSLKQ